MKVKLNLKEKMSVVGVWIVSFLIAPVITTVATGGVLYHFRAKIVDLIIKSKIKASRVRLKDNVRKAKEVFSNLIK